MEKKEKNDETLNLQKNVKGFPLLYLSMYTFFSHPKFYVYLNLLTHKYKQMNDLFPCVEFKGKKN